MNDPHVIRFFTFILCTQDHLSPPNQPCASLCSYFESLGKDRRQGNNFIPLRHALEHKFGMAILSTASSCSFKYN